MKTGIMTGPSEEPVNIKKNKNTTSSVNRSFSGTFQPSEIKLEEKLMKFGGVGQKSRAAVEPGGDHLVPVKSDRKEPSGPVSCPSSTVWTRTSETPHSSSLVFTQNQGEVQEFLLFSAAGWTVRRCCSVGGQNLLTLLPPAETL